MAYSYAPTTYFDVQFGAPALGMSGQFTSVTGLNMEYEYETINEGGCPYPRHFFKNTVPQRLVLEQGTVTELDGFASWIAMINMGMRMPVQGIVMLKNHKGSTMRTWTILDALIVKYEGPSLNSMESKLAVTRIELLYNGCF